MKYSDITGRRYGRLTALSPSSENTKRKKWVCLCDCGKKTVAFGSNLRFGVTKSCGCYRIESGIERNIRHGQAKDSTMTKTYKCWSAMRGRCYTKNNKDYKNYGGRGITVCDRWKVFESFFADMGESPTGTSLGRIDNDGNYEPKNCRWETISQQSVNKRSNLMIEIEGIRKCLSEWAKASGVTACTISRRLRKGMNPKDSVFKAKWSKVSK